MSIIPCNECLGPLPTLSENYITIGCSVPSTNSDTVTVSYPANYTGDVDNINPIPSTITILNPLPDTWSVIMTSNNGSPAVRFTVEPIVLDPTTPLVTTQGITFNTNSQGFAVGISNEVPVTICGQTVTLNRIRITGTALNDVPGLFLSKSSYTIDIGRTAAGLLLSSVTVTLPKRGSFSSQTASDLTALTAITTSLINPKDQVLVPIILIQGQTLFDGSDLSDMKFTIIDEFCYYDKEPLVDTKCGIFCTSPCKLKTTIFRKCCKDTSLCRVLKGQGRNAFEKAMFLYKNDDVLRATTTFPQFYYQNLILYSMSKYILSRILYGKFNIKFLLGKFNKDFFIDLGKSRFCGALSIYNDADNLASYDRFFLFDSKC